MKALRYWGKEDIRLEDIPTPTIGAGEALVKVEYAGICGSDLYIYSGKHPRAKAPLVMGHEICGTLVELEPDTVSNLKAQDKVAINPLLYCGNCSPCRTGNYHVCKNLGLTGIDTDGGFAEYVKVAIHQLVKIPKEMPFEAAALIEPVAVGIHAVRRSKLKQGDRVVVLGGGPIGFIVACCARATGAEVVIISEPSLYRRRFAEKQGFIVVDPGENGIDLIMELTKGEGADIVFEAAGVPATAKVATRLVRILGQIVIVGVNKEPAPVDLQAVNFKELELTGSRVYDERAFHAAVSFINSCEEVKALITHTFSLDKAKEAFTLAHQATNSMKILLKP